MSEQLLILQKNELEIVKEFHSFCEKNNLRYVLAFGSMIGCVRHKGFIPWDDDIDIVMPWDDYCKFNDIANKDPQQPFMVQNQQSVKNHIYPYSRFVKNNTCAIVEYPYVNYFNQAIYIDIFPALYVPQNKFSFKLVQLSNFFYSQTGRMKSSKLYKHTKRGIIAKIGMFIFYCLNKLIPRDFCYLHMYKKALSITKDKAKAYYIGDLFSETNSISQFQLPLDVFDNRILMQFEDTELYMPKDYDSILKKMYGDYMKLPPVEKRKSHGFKFVSDSFGFVEYDLKQKELANNIKKV